MTLVLKRPKFSPSYGINVRPLHSSDVRPRAFVIWFSERSQSARQFVCTSVHTARPLVNSHVRAFQPHSTILVNERSNTARISISANVQIPLDKPCDRHSRVERPNRPHANDVRSVRANRSAIRLSSVRLFAHHRHSVPSARPHVLLNRSTITARPRFCIRTLDTQCGRAFKQQPLVLVFVSERSTLIVDERSNSRPFVLTLRKRTLDIQCGRAFKHQPFVLARLERSTTTVDERFKQSAVRPSSMDSNARHSMWTSVQTVDRPSSSFGSERLTIPVDERSCNQSFVLALWTLSLDNAFGRAFKKSVVHPRFERSTIPVDERSRNQSFVLALCIRALDNPDRSSSRPFGLLLVSTPRQFLCTSVQVLHSSIRPFIPTTFVLLGYIVRSLDLIDARLGAFVASLNIDAKQSAVRSFGLTGVRAPAVHPEALLDLVDVRPRTPRRIEQRDTLPLVDVRPRTPRPSNLGDHPLA
ncbi:hypothetical protein LR48_Vigan05g014400 [Vigna angularis]|uniref:Uncharacterized protein n=1 Tax=Phaseolus angularis TaxID=3914 RepID=A0A0L9UI34_PHAAN|nr:hypothetical protein LR48_Vigan05g014400 [Vigna angularis]